MGNILKIHTEYNAKYPKMNKNERMLKIYIFGNINNPKCVKNAKILKIHTLCQEN